MHWLPHHAVLGPANCKRPLQFALLNQPPPSGIERTIANSMPMDSLHNPVVQGELLESLLSRSKTTSDAVL
jgi:hypothetical protein